MVSYLSIAVLLLLALGSVYPIRLLRNVYYARRTNLPYMIIPFDQDSPIWMLVSVPLRPWLTRNLPRWILDRVLPTIWGWEFHEGDRPFKKWATPTGNGKTMAFVGMGQFEVNSWDAEFVSDVLKRPKDFHEPEFNALFVGRFGHNILTTNGEHWARQRKIMAQVVNEHISKVVFDETIKQATGLLDEVLEQGKLETVDTYEAFDMMKKITIHVLSGAGMGKGTRWNSAVEEPPKGFTTTYMESCKTVMDGMAGPIILPQWMFDSYPSWLPGHQFMKRMGHAVREYPIHTRAMLNVERKRLEQGHETRSNIVSQMVQASQGGKAGTGLTEDEMVGNLFIFTAAGFDTTANTLSYALARLAQDSRWQTWLFEEIDAILPQDENVPLDYAAVFPKAKRIMALMYETLRLYTPLVHIPKMSFGEQTVHTSKQTYLLPPKTTIYVTAQCLHRDPTVWRDLNQDNSMSDATEPDEMVFRPTRWINPDGTLYQPAKATYVPWSMGPRNCPGAKMAQVEFTATFLTLFKKHKIDVVSLQVPSTTGLGSREENAAEVADRMAARIKDSLAILTLQMNNIYDASKAGVEPLGIKLRISRR